jgi:hypothetical protein
VSGQFQSGIAADSSPPSGADLKLRQMIDAVDENAHPKSMTRKQVSRWGYIKNRLLAGFTFIALLQKNTSCTMTNPALRSKTGRAIWGEFV